MSRDTLLSNQVRMRACASESSFPTPLVRKVISEILFDSTSDKKRRQASWNELVFHTEKQYNHFYQETVWKIKSMLGRKE